MAGLCEGGNEPSGSLKAICKWTLLFQLPPCEVRSVIKFLNVQGIAPIEIDRQLCQVYGPNVMSKQMGRSDVGPRLAGIYAKVGLPAAGQSGAHFYRYVDDTLVVWPHGEEKLQEFQEYLNNIHPNIQFTKEVEKDGCFPFLDILISRKSDGTLGHRVYRKPTHTDLYLNGHSHHHPAQKRTVLSTLLHRARGISDKESLPSEICHLRKTFLQNNFGNREIGLALRRAFSDKPPAEEQEETKGMAYIPFYGPISGKISRMLRKHGIKTIHKPPTKIQNLLRPVKDDLGLRTPGVYRIPCECGKCYIGQTGRTIMERCKEHQRSIRLYYPDKSAVAQHSLETGHKIDFSATTILDKTSGYWDLVIKEAIEIQLDGNNFNRDGVYS
ncbi:hypothetical protein ANN_09052 [Periplaneta americana]|uniref:Helix-turn-helix domain-containing protein n=1 Tax=Periplaneta americana TaxID=6978 RepID=A0ABQ8TMH7_PERAM|nr:hypothetical protein ANN_09052 [Periplaneta americana]